MKHEAQLKWGWSFDEERYSFAESRDDAIASAKAEMPTDTWDAFWIAQLMPMDWSGPLVEAISDVDTLFDRVSEIAGESGLMGEDTDEVFDPCTRAGHKLAMILSEAALKWLAAQDGLRWGDWHVVVEGTIEKIDNPKQVSTI